ncbi:MAG: RNA polymerase sigma factor [Pseudomonadota bacterium]
MATYLMNMAERKGHLFLVGDDHGPERRDADLVSAFLQARPRAAADIWDRCYPLVRRIVFRLAGPRQDVDDIIQEVFLRLFRQLPGLRDPSALRAFVLAISVRVVKGDQRGRWLKRWLSLFQDGQLPERATRDADLDAREALTRLYRILDGLSPPHRAAFVLRQIEGLELGEVATALGVSLATLKRWLPRIFHRVYAQAKGDPLLASYLESENAVGVTYE